MNASKPHSLELDLEECRRRLMHSPPSLDVVAPCTTRKGVQVWSKEEVDGWVAEWQKRPIAPEECGLWIPASGAATRMFAPLTQDASMRNKLWTSADSLALGKAWEREVHDRQGAVDQVGPDEATEVLMDMMDGGQFPKGLVPFHVVPTENAAHASETVESAFEAHLRFWALVAPQGSGVWFTVPPSHKAAIHGHLAKRCDENHMTLHLPIQDPATNMPALDVNDEWVRDDRGELLTRPGGHGALLPLLENVDASLILIRNIDNAPSPHRTGERLRWTQAMLAVARKLGEERDALLRNMDKEDADKSRAATWVSQFLFSDPAQVHAWSVEELKDWLDRPIRVVGVVRNDGQPGGGPFWVRCGQGKDEGKILPQIVESIELGTSHADLVAEATHFNPVDMACALRPGQALTPFIDSTRYLKTEKRFGGQRAKVLEHPGLWNGSMSGWLTIFVEIPSACFQPVKSVMDLIDRS